VVCHRCDNPPCVNPAHLFVGSQSDNMRDAVSKGRQKFTKVPASAKPRGERHGSAKLTADDVRAIRAASPREKQRDLAARFGVAQRAVWSILKGRTWKHVKETPDG
jgi:hypothetical protein